MRSRSDSIEYCTPSPPPSRPHSPISSPVLAVATTSRCKSPRCQVAPDVETPRLSLPRRAKAQNLLPSSSGFESDSELTDLEEDEPASSDDELTSDSSEDSDGGSSKLTKLIFRHFAFQIRCEDDQTSFEFHRPQFDLRKKTVSAWIASEPGIRYEVIWKRREDVGCPTMAGYLHLDGDADYCSSDILERDEDGEWNHDRCEVIHTGFRFAIFDIGMSMCQGEMSLVKPLLLSKR